MAERTTRFPVDKKWRYALSLGFFAGLIWGGLKCAEFGLKFTEIVPGFWLEPFYRHSYLTSGWGIGLGLVAFIVFSIAASLLYALLFGKVVGPWMGLSYGLIWWLVIYGLLAPLLNLPTPFWTMNINWLITDLSLFLLWGVFIGYSIAMEFNDERAREPAGQAR
ncbi:YqhR family membrane protein [Paenibacillus cymbidii]|uniref:YqhR family membrane protein n=1 Tax=Paenibacillus cymbidii TaxID=1639034 RepID=UPI001080A3C9|nr:YqhR family membrane protein [Paenibacillus cymbidii]